jgi:hypothetical protein
MKNDAIGVDVSKDPLDAHRLADGATRRFATDKRGHGALIKWLAETPANRVVFEPTGPYHRAIERALGASGVPFVKVNPRRARRFAEANRQAGEDRSPGCGDSGSHGRIAGIAGAPGPKRGLARTEGALRRSRGSGEGSHRRQEPRKSPDAPAVEASERSAPRADQSSDRDRRSGNPPDHRSRRWPLRSLRRPDQHSRHANPAAGLGAPSFEAGAPACARRSTCQRSSLLASIPT